MPTPPELADLRLSLVILALSAGPALAQGPSFDCSKAATGSMEALICRDSGLAGLDRQLAQVYSAAQERAKNEHTPTLRAEQRGWIKERDECWNSGDKQRCLTDEYKRRIAELQARYRLIPGNWPFVFACDDAPGSEVVTTFFQTDPPTLIAERGDSVSLMYVQPSGSGARYAGRNETFWEHQGKARVTWGHGAPEMTCTPKH